MGKLTGLLILFISAFILFSFKQSPTPEGFVTSAGTGTGEIKVVVVKGNPYEMGLQMGHLLKDDIQNSLGSYLKFAQKEAPQIYSDEQLDQAWKTNSPHIDQRVLDEMKGLSEGSGVPIALIQRSHMIPVISGYACSGAAVWGDATKNNHVYQLRNLDYTMDANLQDHPVVVFYIPENGTPHVNVTFAGYIASIAGMNANHIVLGEKGESPMSEYPFDLNGVHFSFLFRTLLYDAKSLDDVLNIVKNTSLIKRYFLFFSDGNEQTMGAAKVLVSTPDSVKLTIWKDNDPNDNLAPNIMPNSIYYTADNTKAYEVLQKHMGTFNEKSMIEFSRTVASQSSSLLNVVFDATTLEMWIAYANKLESAGKQPYVHINMEDYLNK